MIDRFKVIEHDSFRLEAEYILFCDLDTTVPDWIIEHPEALGVFQECSIDYSCGGKSLGYVCDQKGMDRMMVLEWCHRTTKASVNES